MRREEAGWAGGGFVPAFVHGHGLKIAIDRRTGELAMPLSPTTRRKLKQGLVWDWAEVRSWVIETGRLTPDGTVNSKRGDRVRGLDGVRQVRPLDSTFPPGSR